MRREVAWSLMKPVVLGAALFLSGCANPIDRMCATRADYFESCAGTATDRGWDLAKDYSFYQLGGRDEFVQTCEQQAQQYLDTSKDDVERKRLQLAFEDQAIQYENLVATATCAQIP